MSLDFSKINAGLSSSKQIDPRKIFTTLKRHAKFKRPSDEQGDVLDGWFKERNRGNNTLKMNTGSGKTVVGLLCLQSSLNEDKGPAVYVCPDKYLVRQVIAEALALGIAVTEDEKDSAFISGNAILVANVWKLVNARSVFGVGFGTPKIGIGSIVVDDAHACLATVAEQFAVRLLATHPAFGPLLALFEDDLKAQSESGYLDLVAQDPQSLMLIPFWAWIDKQSKVLKILHPYRNDEALQWSWKLIEDVLPFCQCVFGGGKLEIAPRYIPIDIIPVFTGAERRIYMTATLADDGILISHFQADANEIAQPIRPNGGGDIGDRMILAPQEITPEITIDEIKSLVRKLSQTINVSVIVPSLKRSEYWQDCSQQTLTADNVEAGTQLLRQQHVGLTVFVNKYDGIDLPSKACELMIIDGLPEVNGLIERIEQSTMDGTRRQLIRQIQRIEQGMGRGVRSSEDHCVVLLVGARLTQRLHRPEARDLFSVATRAQIDLGREVTIQLKGKPLSEIENVIKLCLEQDGDWVTTSRNAVVNAQEGKSSHIDDTVELLRNAFDHARLKQFDEAEKKVQQAINKTVEPRTKGYLKQQLAEYCHHTNPTLAQEIQLAAVQLNRALIRPIQGINYTKVNLPKGSQAVTAVSYMNKFLEMNELVMWVNGLIESLAWGEENTKRFEADIYDLGNFLGFGSQRPEEQFGRGPDNLWALGNLSYLVIECKSGAVKAKNISKGDCNQLNGSVTWFNSEYDQSCSSVPILIHQKVTHEYAATLPAETRIMNEDKLGNLLGSLRKYSIAISKNNGYSDPNNVATQLDHFGLAGQDFVARFTVKFKSG